MNSETPADKAEKLQELATEIHRIFSPQWSARADVFKTVVSVSSGAIVLAVTFSSSLRSLVGALYWQRLVFISFVLLTISLVVAFAGLWLGARAYEIQSAIFKVKNEMLQLLSSKPSPEQFLEAVQEITRDELQPIMEHDKRADACFWVSSISFCIAMVLLALAGGRQMLF